MQERQKQLTFQYQTNLYNKLNYHLKKTEPFKNKGKRTVTEQMKQYNRNQKVSTINNKKYSKKVIKQYEQPEHINQEHVTPNVAVSQVRLYEKPISGQRKGIFERGVSETKLKKIDLSQRGKSLKYWKVQKSQPKFLTQIKGFFNTFLSEDNGCKCGSQCLCTQILLKWINVSDELIQKNYIRLLNIAYEKQSVKISKVVQTRMSNDTDDYDIYESKQQKQQRLKYKIQIQKDVIRTQTQKQLFHRPQIQSKMQRILMCYIVQDPEVGYVQSMNIVVSGILYHIRDQAKTYAVCRKIFHQIRKIYLNDFKECYRHVDKLISLIQMHILDLSTHLQNIGVQLRVVIFPWILSLLCVVVPLQQLHLIYMGYVREGWRFIYKTILALFVYHKQKIMEMHESGDILVFLSVSNQAQKQNIDWEDIVNFGQRLTVYV